MASRWLSLSLLSVLACIPQGADAQERPVRWAIDSGASGRIEERIRAGLEARIDRRWKLYSLTQQSGGPIATTIALGDTTAFRLDSIVAPRPDSFPDRNFNIFTEIYTDSVSIDLWIRGLASARAGRHDVPVLVTFQTCTNRYCLPPRTDTLSLTVTHAAARVAGGTATPATPSVPIVAAVDAASAPSPATASPAIPPRSSSAPSPKPLAIVAPTDAASLIRFLWLAVTMGLLSLLTPCVLPMIPITVGYFSGGASSSSQRTRSALAHAGGIVLVFTALGFLVTTFFGAAGIVRLAASPVLNAIVATLFFLFALNLLGVFDITLPQRLLTSVSRWGGDGRRHAAGALLMGGAFGITSFTCTMPFVGTLLVLATQGSWRWPLAGLAVYGAAFALPFFMLAAAPGSLARFPRSGPWMDLLKRSLAVIEIALALKFLSNVDLVIGSGILPRPVMIGLWGVAAIVLVALWGDYARSARGTARGIALAGVGICWLFGAWLGQGLRGRNLGELEAYLPPRVAGPTLRFPEASAPPGATLSWIMNDYSGALASGRSDGRPVLLDFTGYTCTNCRWMEANMFVRPEVVAHLRHFVRARLYTDGLGEPYLGQQRLQLEAFGTIALPYYAVVTGDGAPVATFLGMTRDSREFIAFLQGARSRQPSRTP